MRGGRLRRSNQRHQPRSPAARHRRHSDQQSGLEDGLFAACVAAAYRCPRALNFIGSHILANAETNRGAGAAAVARSRTTRRVMRTEQAMLVVVANNTVSISAGRGESV
eukprot:2955620-Rhodomonas_salina.1